MANPTSYTWDATARRFRSAGRFVATADVRVAIDAFARGVGGEIRAVSERLQSGEINAAQWERDVRGLIKAAHLASGGIALGGKAGLDARSLGRLGAIIKGQMAYLRSFGREIEAGLPLDGRFLSRSEMYGQASRSTFENISRAGDIEAGYDEERRVIGGPNPCRGCRREAAKGWRPAGELLPIGQCECLTGCHCSFERRKSGKATMGNRVPFNRPAWSNLVPFGKGGGGSKAPAKAAQAGDKPGKPKGSAKLHGAGNCGNGKGGFKPGNTCGKSGRAKLAADLKAARSNADAHGGHAALRDKAKALKMHRRGHDHAIADEHAGQLRAGLRTGKAAQRGKIKAETVAHAHAEVKAAHAVQRARNAKDAVRKPVHESPRPESAGIRHHRESMERVKGEHAADVALHATKTKELADLDARMKKTYAKTNDYSLKRATREKHDKAYDELAHKYRETQSQLSDIGYRLDPKFGVHAHSLQHHTEMHTKAVSDHAALGPIRNEYAVHQANQPDLIAPGPITDRIAKYRVGDAKVKAINAIQNHYEIQDHTLASERSYHHRQINEHIERQGRHIEADPSLSPETHAKVDALQRKIDQHAIEIERVKSAQKTLEANRRDDIAKTLHVDRPMTFHADDIRPGVTTSSGPLSPLTADTRQAFGEAHQFLGKSVARGDNHSVRVEAGEGPGYRAHYRGGAEPHIQARINEDPSVVVHEYGHALDHQATVGGDRLNDRSQEFLKHRVGDEPLVDMHAKFGAGDPGEMGRKDRFENAMGDDYSAHYTGKHYGHGSSEILSMGMEQMHRNAGRFVARDPEYAKFVMGAMDGSLR